MEGDNGGQKVENPNPNPNKTKVVVIMGATGSGKSKLAIDLASHFPIEIINSDSMQVYQGLDVLTNKVPLHEQNGVPHHLLGTISSNVEFTSKDFRDSAIPLIDDIISRNNLPVLVGGTNYYIQALVSPFLLDDSAEEMDESSVHDHPGGNNLNYKIDSERDGSCSGYDRLKDLDPVAANRIHPNDHRNINQYLGLYARTGVLPSKLFQGKAMENWGRVDNFKYRCCFICVDAALPILDGYVGQRVDSMIDAGLLDEVYDIYSLNADYTRGLRQAIGVREFEDFLKVLLSEGGHDKENGLLKGNVREILKSSNNDQHNILLQEAIERVKANTRRLVRRQKRRFNRLQSLFGWDIHYVDATESLSCNPSASWAADVVEPSVKIIRSFLRDDASSIPDLEGRNGAEGLKSINRDLWTQYICKACGDRVLRGLHEWEQHKQGRGHRKRISRSRNLQSSCLTEQQQQQLLRHEASKPRK